MALLERIAKIALFAFKVVVFLVRFAFASWCLKIALKYSKIPLPFACDKKVYGYLVEDYSVFFRVTHDVILSTLGIFIIHWYASHASSFVRNCYNDFRLWLIVRHISNLPVQNLVMQHPQQQLQLVQQLVQQLQQLDVQAQDLAPLMQLQQQLLQLQGQNVADAG